MHFPHCFTNRGGFGGPFHHMPDDRAWGPFGRGGGLFGRGGAPFARGRGPFGRSFGPSGACGPSGCCDGFGRHGPRETLFSGNPMQNADIEEQIRKVVREFFNERRGGCGRGQHHATGRVGRGSFHPWHFGGHFQGRFGWAGWTFGPCEFQGRNNEEGGQDAAGKATEGGPRQAPTCGWHYRPDLAHHECHFGRPRTCCARSGRCTEEDSSEEDGKQDGTNCCCQIKRHARRSRNGRCGGHNVAHDSQQEVSDAEVNASAAEENLENIPVESENVQEQNVASGSKPTSTEQ